MVFSINTVIVAKEIKINVNRNKPEIACYKRKEAAVRGNEKITVPYHSKWKPLWPSNVTGNNKNYLYLDIKDLIFCPILTKFGSFGYIFLKNPNIKFYIKPSSDSRNNTSRQKDRQEERNTDGVKTWYSLGQRRRFIGESRIRHQ